MNKQTILRIAKYISISLLTVFIAAIMLGGGLFLYYVNKAPELSESKLVATTSSKIYDSKNELIADLGDMHKAVLVHAHVDEGAKVDDVAHRALEFHAGLQVVDRKRRAAKDYLGRVVARVAAALYERIADVIQGRLRLGGVLKAEMVKGYDRLQGWTLLSWIDAVKDASAVFWNILCGTGV